MGTFDYISPEQARDPRNADVRSDLYSLGCTFFYMLTGRPPFPEGTVLQKLLQHQGDQPPDVRQFRPELPEGVCRVLRAHLGQRSPPPLCRSAEMVADLLLVAHEAGIGPGRGGGKSWLPRERPAAAGLRRHLPWVAPLAALLSIVLLLNHVWSPPADQEGLPSTIGQGRHQPAETAPPSTAPAAAGRKGAARTVRTDGPARPATGETSPPAMAAGGDETPVPPESRSTAAPFGRAGLPAGEPGDDSGQFNPWKALTPGIAQLPPGDARRLASSDGLSGSGTSFSGLSDPVGGGSFGTITAGSGIGTGLSDAGGLALVPPKHTGTLIVDRQAGPGEFSSLGAACAAAVNGDEIGLRFDGPLEEQPIRLANLRVTIHAVEGHRPVLVFRPTEPNPVKCPRSMMTAAAARLTMIGVAIELKVPRAVLDDQWSLLETRGDAIVLLEQCSLVIDNASEQLGTYHQDVAFVRTRAAPGADTVLDDGTAAPTPPATIRLVDCTAVGEAVFLRAEDLQPVHLSWTNGLLATTERLLSAGGGADAASRPGAAGRTDARHRAGARRLVPDCQQPDRPPSPAPAMLVHRFHPAGPGGQSADRADGPGGGRRLPPPDHLDGRSQLLRRL